MVKFTLRLICALLLPIQAVLAQQTDRAVVNQPLEWFAVTSNTKVSKRLTVMVEGQFRQVSDFDPQQYQLRTALDIKLTDHLSIVPFGYVYTWNYKYGKQPAVFANNEHRTWQQVFYKHSIGTVKLDHRLRLEQRFIQHHTLAGDGQITDDGYSVHQNRLRYRLMARLPLNSKKIEPKTYFLSAYDEVFVSWGDKVTYHEPDQNRLFAGAGYQFNKTLTLQGGFLYQMLVKANGAMQENNLGFQVQVTLNIDCTKVSNP